MPELAPTLFRRCVECPQTQPSCPVCPSGQVCSLLIQTCNHCAQTSCEDESVVNGSGSSGKHGPSAAGPIAGGVVGGIIVIAVIVYLVYRFCIKKRRHQFEQNEWPDDRSRVEKSDGMDQFSMSRDPRASTHTVASVASTMYTRASNIIQIAYIPGVTNRSVESSPELIPPIPPMPALSTSSSTASPQRSGLSSPHIPTQDQLFFSPNDLRNSAYSAFSNRNSLARSSVATTIYRNNAIVEPVPAQTLTRLKATPVSVKTSGKNGANASPPTLSTQSSIIGRFAQPKSVTVHRSAAAMAREQVYELSGDEASASPISLPEAQRHSTAPRSHGNGMSTLDDASSDEEESSPQAAKSLISQQQHASAEELDDIPITPHVGPYFAPLSHSSSKQSQGSKHKKTSSLSELIEAAARKASQEPLHGGLGSLRHDPIESSPFSDANAAGTP